MNTTESDDAGAEDHVRGATGKWGDELMELIGEADLRPVQEALLCDAIGLMYAVEERVIEGSTRIRDGIIEFLGSLDEKQLESKPIHKLSTACIACITECAQNGITAEPKNARGLTRGRG